MDINFLLIQILNGVQYGLLLFLVASGLTLIFGIMGIINLAHGSFYMIGAYVVWALIEFTGNTALSVVLALLISFIAGVVLELSFYKHLYKRDHLYQVLMTYGLILIFEDMRSIFWGDEVHGVSAPNLLSGAIQLTENLDYPIYRLVLSLACVLVALGLYFIIQKTKLGMMIRAGASNNEMTRVLGININVIYTTVFSMGVTLAALGGIIAAPISSVYPNMGGQILIMCFVVVIIGGIGSIWGALFGALLIGLGETFGRIFFPEYAGLTVYILMVAILLWRPEGLLKRSVA